MKIHSNVLELVANNATKQSIKNLVFAIINHVSDEYDNNGEKVNNILGILTGDALVNPNNIDIDEVIKLTDWVYKYDEISVLDSNVIKVDNITGFATIEYTYTSKADDSGTTYTSTFDISYLDNPSIVVL